MCQAYLVEVQGFFFRDSYQTSTTAPTIAPSSITCNRSWGLGMPSTFAMEHVFITQAQPHYSANVSVQVSAYPFGPSQKSNHQQLLQLQQERQERSLNHHKPNGHCFGHNEQQHQAAAGKRDWVLFDCFYKALTRPACHARQIDGQNK